jgi:hypothetical protein
MCFETAHLLRTNSVDDSFVDAENRIELGHRPGSGIEIISFARGDLQIIYFISTL